MGTVRKEILTRRGHTIGLKYRPFSLWYDMQLLAGQKRRLSQGALRPEKVRKYISERERANLPSSFLCCDSPSCDWIMAAILLRLALCACAFASFSASATDYKAAQQTVVIYGATGGGFGAAISAAREQAESGHVVLISLSSHVGGMVTGGLQVYIAIVRAARPP